jgi:excisionase family DNA binding protein
MNSDTSGVAPIAYTVNKAVMVSGMSRPVIYREIKAGRLRSLTVGKRRLIMHSDLLSYFAARAEERAA